MGKDRQTSTANSLSPGLSRAQRDIWFDQQRLADAATYNIGGYLSIAGRLDRQRFALAVTLLTQQNDALRLRLNLVEGVPRLIDAPLPLDQELLAFTDLSNQPDPQRLADQLCQDALDRPFDLQGGPLFRASLLKLSDSNYRWINVYHHLICDGWGTGLVLGRLAAIYRELTARQVEKRSNPWDFLALKPADTPQRPAPPPCPSFLAHLDQLEKAPPPDARLTARLAARQAFWRARFQQLPPPLFQTIKSTDKPRSASLSTALAREDFARIAQVAATQGASPLHFFLTALYLYFVRTQNLQALVVGLPLRNRTGRREKQTVGLFTSVAALPLSLDLRRPTSALLAQVAREVKQSYRQLPVSLAEVIRDSGAMAQGRSRIFDLALSFEPQDYPLTFGEAPAEAVAVINQDQQTPLSLFVREYHDDQDINLEFAYRRDIFEEDQIRIIARDLTFLLKDIAARPDAPSDSRSLLPPQIHKQLTRVWPQEGAWRPAPPLAPQRILQIADKAPTAPALIYGAQRWSYAQLATRAGQLAQALRNRGVGREDRIAVALSRGPDLVLAQLAVLLTGAAFVPLDPGHPLKRRLAIVQQGQLAGYLTDQAESLPLPDGVQRLSLAPLRGESEKLHPIGLADLSPLDPRQAAYVIFTSGSTGQPKGVVIEHGGLANLIMGQIQAFHLRPASRVLQFATPAFDAAVSEIFVTLGVGAQLVLAPAKALLPGTALKALIADQAVTHVTLPPSALALMEPADYPSLDVVISAGEPCPPQVARRWKAEPRGPSRQFINAYGPTEVSVCATTYAAPGLPEQTGEQPYGATLPIGRPLPNVLVYVLDDTLSPLPEGVIGELCVGGAGVARGYLNQPERSKSAFYPNPFRPGERLYRTGDLARWRGDGTLEFIERRDQQIKLRGFRIEPGEVEACLTSHPAIEQSLVLARDQRLLAYLVADPQPATRQRLLIAELRELAAQQLPAYMVPAHFILLAAFPLTPAGKIDRAALPPPQPLAENTGGRAPRSGQEALVAALFAEVLTLDHVDPEADFFALGGHSLLAAQMANRLGGLLARDVPLQLIFENPSAAALSAVLTAASEAATPETPTFETPTPGAGQPPTQRASAGPVALSRQQERLWFLDQLGGPGIAQAYLVSLALQLTGPLNRPALEQAYLALLTRQEALRSRVLATDAGPRQIVDPPRHTTIPVTDLAGRSQADQQAAIQQAAQRPFDLARDWPIRAELFQLDRDRQVLLLSLHHIACDGWSMGLLADGLSRGYRQALTGADSEDPPLALSYGDYSRWQRERERTNQFQEDLSYWRRQLAELPSALDLPFSHPRPAVQSYHGGQRSFTLDRCQVTALRHLGRQRGCTLFMTLAALFALLLQRLGAGEDIPLGTPIAGRAPAALEPIVGLFVNSLVLRLRPKAQLTFLELLAQTRQTALAAYRHADLPFEQVVEAVQPTRSLAHAPLFQVLFTLDSHSQRELDKRLTFTDLTCRRQRLATNGAKLDLSLYLEEGRDADGQDQLGGAFEYNSSLFEPARIDRLLSEFQQLITAVLERPEAPLQRHGLLDPLEEQRLLSTLAQGAPLNNNGKSLLEEICAQAAHRPDALAILWPATGSDSSLAAPSIGAGDDDRADADRDSRPGSHLGSHPGLHLSYRQLWAASDALAATLRRKGLGPEDLVALALPRSPLVVVAMLAVWRCGAAFLPLDPSHPQARRRLLLQDAAPRLLLCDAAGCADPQLQRYDCLALSDDMLHPPATPQGSVDRDAWPSWPQPGAAAYLLYTSGSTNQPKGVWVEQRALSAFHQAMEQALGPLQPDDRLAAVTTTTFDISLFELFAPLRKGATLLLVPTDISKDGPALAALLDQQAVTLLQATPSSYRLLQSAAWQAPHRPTLYCGGEALQPDLARQLLSWGRRAVNLYGPTEATIWSSYHVLTADDLRSDGPLSLGRPLPGWCCYVLDEQLTPQPEGVPGELFIAGPGLARGYHNAPEQTAAAFLNAPFDGAGRLYRSGDLAAWQSNGGLAFLGRRDHQIKLRGFRIEPGEVESCLLSHPDVRQALVISQNERLVAYLVPSAAASGSHRQLRQDLQTRLGRNLPDYMQPNLLIFLEAFPLNAAGKIDRKRLPPPEAQPGDAAGQRGAASARETLICAVFADVLQLSRVAPEDSFFDLGGQSLLAAQAVARLADSLGTPLPLRLLFQAPSAAQLAPAIERLTPDAASDLPLVGAPDDTGAPLTFQQERLWFLETLNGGAPDEEISAPAAGRDLLADADRARQAYLIPLCLQLRGTLDVPALKTALTRLVATQASLRTRVVVTEQGLVHQQVDPAAAPALSEIDLRGLGQDAQQDRVQRLAFQPFDLTKSWPLRCALLRRGPADWTLLLTLHHLAADGWSLQLLEKLLQRHYQAALDSSLSSASQEGDQRQPDGDPGAPSISYLDYARWQRARQAQGAFDRDLAYWRKQLADLPELLDLPLDRPRPAVQSYAGASCDIAVHPDQLASLKKYGQAAGATLFMTLATCFALLLKRLGCGDDLPIGIAHAGRGRPELDGLVGLFVNTLVLRLRPEDGLSFKEFLRQVRHTALQAYGHGEAPFEQVVEALRPNRSLSHSPLFQVMFALEEPARGPQLLAPGLTLTPHRLTSPTAKQDLSLHFQESDNPDGQAFLQGVLEYNSQIFDPETIAAFCRNFSLLLQSLLDQPDLPVEALALLSVEEEARLTQTWAAGPALPAPRGPVLDDIARTAHKQPHRPALLNETETWNYAQLWRTSRRIAARLRSLAVGPEARVVLALPRCPLAIAGILAIWRARACLLPLDPKQPLMRRRLILEDAAPALILTDDAGRNDPLFQNYPCLSLTAFADPDAGGAGGADSDPPDLSQPAGNTAWRQEAAYLLYTSGSTGQPKGVLIEQGALADHQAGLSHCFPLTPQDRTLETASLSFDTALDQILTPLRAGAGLVFLPEQAWSAPELKRLSARFNLTWLDLPTAYWRSLVASWREQPALLPNLKQLSVGGEALSAADLDLWQSLAAPDKPRLINAYGPTEATITACAKLILDDDSASHPFGASVGRPLAGRRCYVLDRRQRPVPTGVAGELCLGGIGLARGYDGRPELTAKAFLPDAFLPGSRLYRTGDQARWRRDGTLEFLGRKDQQIKLRGFRIEPGEVAAACTAHPAIEQALVLQWRQQLVAYLVPAGGPVKDPSALKAALRRHLEARLPDYMAPAHLVFLAAFALTPSGKIDRQALPSPEQAEATDRCGPSAAAKHPPQPPRGPLERRLVALYQELLCLPKLDRQAHFFELGGHSLLALQLVSRLSQTLKTPVASRLIFEAPRVAHLAIRLEALQAQTSTHNRAVEPQLQPQKTQSPAPLSFQQERLWFLDRLGGEEAAQAYLIPLALRLHGRLNVAALETAIAALLDNQPQLRSRFGSRQGKPYQVLDPATAAAQLLFRDIATQGAAEQQTILADAAQQPFDLARQWPVRFQLFQLGEKTWALLITLHHLVADGWSSGEVAEELSQAYRAALSGAPSPRRPAPLSYVDYIHWQRQRQAAGCFEPDLKFWERTLAGAPPRLPLPLDQPRAPRPSYRGGVQPITLDAPTLAALKALGAACDASLFMTLAASFALFLQGLGAGDDLPIGTPAAGRNHPALDSLVGLFVNTLVLRLQPRDGDSFRAFLTAVRATALAAYEHGEAPFDQVVERLAPQRDLSHNPLFQVMFALDRHDPRLDSRRLALPGLSVSRLSLTPPVAKVDLTLFLEERNAEGDGAAHQPGLHGGLEYNADLFSPARVAAMAKDYLALVKRLLDAPDDPLAAPPKHRSTRAADRPRPPVSPPRPLPAKLDPAPQSLAAVLAIWGELLRPDDGRPVEFDGNSHFFDRGGHSLLAVQLAEKLEQRLQRPVPLALVFEHPRAADLARALDERGEREEKPEDDWLTVSDQGSGPPLICLPPATGFGLWAYGMARHFKTRRRVFSLQSSGLRGGMSASDQSLEDMAEDCLAQLQAKGVTGKGVGRIALAGWSFGAHLAYALAQKLKDRQENIASLIVIDAAAPASRRGRGRAEPPLPQEDSALFRALLPPDLGLDPDRWQRLHEDARLALLLDLAAGHPNLPSGLDLPGLRRMLRVTRQNSLAMAGFHPNRWRGDLHLVRAQEEPDGPDLLDWDRLTSGAVHLHWVPGNHGSMVQGDNAAQLARVVEGLLGDAHD